MTVGTGEEMMILPDLPPNSAQQPRPASQQEWGDHAGNEEGQSSIKNLLENPLRYRKKAEVAIPSIEKKRVSDYLGSLPITLIPVVIGKSL